MLALCRYFSGLPDTPRIGCEEPGGPQWTDGGGGGGGGPRAGPAAPGS